MTIKMRDPSLSVPTDFCPFKPLFANYQMLFKKCIHSTHLLLALRESVSIFCLSSARFSWLPSLNMNL